MNLFQPNNVSFHKQTLDLPDATISYYPHLFTVEEANMYFETLLKTTDWRQDAIKIFGKTMPIPRLQAWYGDKGTSYSYSGIQMEPLPWNEPLLAIKARIERVANVPFNSVLLNQYRTGKDSNGWHADDEPELGKNPVIGSVSFGGERFFKLKHKKDKNLKAKMLLKNGSFLLMAGETQTHWLHTIPKTAKAVEARINLTFRRTSCFQHE